MTVTEYIKKIAPLCKTDLNELLEELLDETGKNSLSEITLEEAAVFYEMLTQRLRL